MPLPLPNLDTRRWADLVDEARAILPRYAPAWTDHNIHDPGITVLELLAWFTEQGIYRANRVPARHRRKFLALAGFAVGQPEPARTTLSLEARVGAASLLVPAGVGFAGQWNRAPGAVVRTVEDLRIVDARIAAVIVFDGESFVDRTRAWRDGSGWRPLGAAPISPRPYDAGRAPALYVVVDRALPTAEWVSFVLLGDGAHGNASMRAALERESREEREACTPPRPDRDWPCAPERRTGASGTYQPALSAARHHSVRVVWEYFDGGPSWRTLEPGDEVADETRALTLDGVVRVRLPSAMQSTPIGGGTARYALRCRLLDGAFDAAPSLRRLAVNAVAAEQSIPEAHTFTIARGVVAGGVAPVAGRLVHVAMRFGEDEAVRALSFDDDPNAEPRVLLLAFTPATAAAEGTLTLAVVPLGRGTGKPCQEVMAPGAPISRGALRLWSLEDLAWRPWEARLDFDASSRTDRHFLLDAGTGRIVLGDGEHGRVAPAGAPIVAAYATTAGARGNRPPGGTFMLDGRLATRVHLAPATADDVGARVAAVTNLGELAGGADAEAPGQAEGRVLASLWAHERLTTAKLPGTGRSLDQLARDAVDEYVPPARATTLLDFERLALNVPGTLVRRARAVDAYDPAHPGLRAMGDVTVVIVPELPPDRPSPSVGLRRAVRGYLQRRRLVGTRIHVAAPDYLVVDVTTVVRARAETDAQRVQAEVVRRLSGFLHPLTGGPLGQGWPFGRDVYRGELLALIDAVAGVDHVLSLELAAHGVTASCGNICVGPLTLVSSGTHRVEVRQP